MDPPARSRCSILGAEDVERAIRAVKSSSNSSSVDSSSDSAKEKAIPSEPILITTEERAAVAANSSGSRSSRKKEDIQQEEEKASLDEDCTTVFGSSTTTDNHHHDGPFTSVVEARASLVVDEDYDYDDNNNTTTSISTPDRKPPAYAAFPPHLLVGGAGVSPLRFSTTTDDSRSNSIYTTATATTTTVGGESFQTGRSSSGTIPPDAHLLRFKHQVQDFEPPSVVLSSRHIQTVVEPIPPEAAPVREQDESSSRDLPSEYGFSLVTPQEHGGGGGGFTNDNDETTAPQRDRQAELELIAIGFPDGLARHLVRDVKSVYPIRFWCIDNSASMFHDDCRRRVAHPYDATATTTNHRFSSSGSGGGSSESTVKCTRWMELLDTVQYHAKLAGIMGATTVFRLLNHYSNAPEEYVVHRESDTARVVAILDEIQPDGVSLLTQHVSSVTERIESIEHNLRTQGQKAVVVLATDGLPSDQYGESTPAMQADFIYALKQLQLMPVWIVIRLCTTDRDVLNFYRRLDKELELPVDVIGGFLTEAKEVVRLNKWLNYAMPLHRAREMGLLSRLPDLLDERQLTKDEFREMAELLFEKKALEEAPDIHTDWLEFVKHLQDHVLPRTGQQWNPETKRVENWIDCGKLKTAYGAGLRHKKDKLVLGMQRAFSKDVI